MSNGNVDRIRFGRAKESAQTTALRRFFPGGRGRIDGRIEPGFFETDLPDLREAGTVESKWIMGGLFCVFTWRERIYAGSKKVGEIEGHSIIGWDSQQREYRMLRAANVGVMHQLSGKLRGDRLTFISDEVILRGEPSRVRYCFVRKGKGVLAWVAEISVDGGSWDLLSKDEIQYS